MTKAQLQKRILKTGKEIWIENERPHECNNQGTLTMYLESETEEFVATDGLCCCAPYWSDITGSLGEAYASLAEDLACGFQEISYETKHAADFE